MMNLPSSKRLVEDDSNPSGGPSVVDKSGVRVRGMFASIANRYDFMNHLLSLSIDRSWRRLVSKQLAVRPGERVLDCCTGTADLALAFDRQRRGGSTVIGTDFCRPMLEVGLKKLRTRKPKPCVRLIEADTQALPFSDNTFAVVTVAFGLRNVANTIRGLDEMIRVAQPGGRVAILEFSRPKQPLLGRVYGSFFRHVLPRVGQALAPNGFGAYEYLPSSVRTFPEGAAMVELLSSRGLIDVTCDSLTFGVASLYVGTKPLNAPVL
jgi:demethylmenaquinone methyltransferase/2-methoxy-6-polyprenyl-1,4-benzoquinol methylase